MSDMGVHGSHAHDASGAGTPDILVPPPVDPGVFDAPQQPPPLPPPPPTGYCRQCGIGLDASSARRVDGFLYCSSHAPRPATPPPPPPNSPYHAAPPPMNNDVSPGVAFILGLIPGVGAIYNGQYAKGLVHVLVIGLMISVLDRGDAHSLEPLVGLMLAGFWAYMAFEAHHTARQRRMGLVPDEMSSLFPTQGSRVPVAPLLLICLGVIFLLDNLGVLDFDRVFRFWPVLMIGLGVYLLYIRLTGAKDARKGGEGTVGQ